MEPSQIAAAFSYLFDLGKDILFAGLDKATNTILCQIGNSTDQVADSDSAELWQQPGLWSLPAAPTQGKPSCQALVIKRSDRDVIFATRDLRNSSIYGNLKPGETCIGASDVSSQARMVFKLDGSASIATKDNNKATGNDVYIRLAPTECRFFSPFGTQLQDNTGWHLRTWHGGKIDLTGLGLPAPFSSLGLNSTLMVTVDVANINAAVLSLGRDAGFTQSVVQALPLQTILATVATALTDLNTTLSLLATTTLTTGANSGGPVVFAGLAAFASDVTTLGTAISAVNTALALIATPAATGGTATKTTVA